MNQIAPYSHFIDGQWIAGEGPAFITHDPATGDIIREDRRATDTEAKAAHAAASRALPAWSALGVHERALFLKRFAEQVEIRKDTITHQIALETGKPLWEARTETASVIGKIALSIAALEARADERTTQTPEALARCRFKPHGVAAVLGAFNFPAHLSNGHIAPALLAGNTILYKPSEFAPGTAALIMGCWEASGLPAGVLNMVQGDRNTGTALLDTPVDAVFFTGSYATGLAILRKFCERPEVIVALEMGGNNPLVIDNVANPDAAVYTTLLSTMITAGQRCTCARRVMIPDNAFGDAFVTRFVSVCQTLQIGPFTRTPEPFMGPVITANHAQQHLARQHALEALGGKVLLRMTSLAANTGLLSPGIIDMTGVENVPDEEIFAPFVQLYRYQTPEEAIALSNRTRYGLASGIVTDLPERYEAYYAGVRAGLVNWNRPTTGASGALPFGGVGRSGNHRPSAWFAADYCAWPVASLEQATLELPKTLLPGVKLCGENSHA